VAAPPSRWSSLRDGAESPDDDPSSWPTRGVEGGWRDPWDGEDAAVIEAQAAQAWRVAATRDAIAFARAERRKQAAGQAQARQRQRA
jgi:hypothetical protein